MVEGYGQEDDYASRSRKESLSEAIRSKLVAEDSPRTNLNRYDGIVEIQICPGGENGFMDASQEIRHAANTIFAALTKKGIVAHQ